MRAANGMRAARLVAQPRDVVAAYREALAACVQPMACVQPVLSHNLAML